MGVEYSKAAIARRVGVTAVGLAVLAAGAAYGFKGGDAPVECKSEIISCTGTGGLAKYAFCNWREPVDDSGSGSLIKEIYHTVGRSPVSVSVDFTIGSSATTSGTVIPRFNNITTSSGSQAFTSTGAFLVNSGDYLRIVTLTNPGGGHTSTLKIDYCTRLSKF